MTQAKLLAVATALLVATFLVPESSAGVPSQRALAQDVNANPPYWIPDRLMTDDRDVSTDSPASGEQPNPEAAAQAGKVQQESSSSESDSVDERFGNEVAPLLPAATMESESMMEPGQTWESTYKHGVAPAKLPALENDNVHNYRHSIIHPYGDDIHA